MLFIFSEEFVKLQVSVSRLESDKQVIEEELEQQKRYAEREKKEILVQVAKFRTKNEQLAINYETTKNELFKLKSALASIEDKCKRLEDERNSLKNLNAAHEQTIKRAATVINEYVCQNEDGSSAGLTGGEVLQLKADVKRLEEQLRQKRSQSDAFRHISTEEQRLITTEWYEQASQHLRQKYLATASSTLNGDSSRAQQTPDQFNYTAHSHLSDMQNTAMSSARSTPTHSGGLSHPNTSTNSTPNSSMSNSMNASVDNSGVMGQVRSFLGLQRDQQPHRTPAR
jgi:DNA repair exonuclease SbcCD ATPase subunit